MQSSLPKQDVVLLGIGHTHAHVVRMWRMKALAGTRLTCVSNYPVATYSGMLPGVLAGQYADSRMQIDLVRLCASVDARLIVGDVHGLDLQNRRLLIHDRAPVPFDVLSIGVGSVPSRNAELDDATILTIKPMQTFLDRLDARLRELAAQARTRRLRIAVVGAGAGGVEVAFCLPARVKTVLGCEAPELAIVGAHSHIPFGAAASTQRRVRKEMLRHQIGLKLGHRVTSVRDGKMHFDDGQATDVDLVIWATGAEAAPWLSQLDLATDSRGFIRTRTTLQSVSDDGVFAVGDCGTIDDVALAKAGVYAVRQGPILWENIDRFLQRRPLRDYRPQSGFLKLLNTAGGSAIAEYKGWAAQGRWCWRLKDRIDGRFMDKYQTYEPPQMSMAQPSAATPTIRCAGCGSKVAGSVLSRVFERLEIPPHADVVLGLETPDDAAILRCGENPFVTATVDFFTAPIDDPYLVGRIAALNAASDLFAMGAKPTAALAMAALPLGPERQQAELLFQLLSGSLREFQRMGASLVGGHTTEGAQLTLGFAMLALRGANPPRAKNRLRPGDALILTKPLGTGVLLAAQMRAACRATWYETLLESMLTSNDGAARVADEFGLAAVTDITGFGLAGHLLEMLNASQVACQLSLDRVPLLPGSETQWQQGLESTLAPANRSVEPSMRVAERLRQTARYAALFDPQTSGGLLLAAPAKDAERVVARLREACQLDAHSIGLVTESTSSPIRLEVV